MELPYIDENSQIATRLFSGHETGIAVTKPAKQPE
jgi:hypothetical protein